MSPTLPGCGAGAGFPVSVVAVGVAADPAVWLCGPSSSITPPTASTPTTRPTGAAPPRDATRVRMAPMRAWCRQLILNGIYAEPKAGLSSRILTLSLDNRLGHGQGLDRR